MTVVVRLDPDVCPDCGHPLEGHAYDQPALFIAAGYGATARTVLRHCSSCGWSLVAERGEVRP
jgi:uncharacterized Zn finger protein (UPF0148 family)